MKKKKVVENWDDIEEEMNEQELQIFAEYSEDYINRYSAVKDLTDFNELERIAVSDVSSVVREMAIQRIKQLYPNKAKRFLSENNTPEFIKEYNKDLEHTKRELIRRKQKKEYERVLKRIQKRG